MLHNLPKEKSRRSIKRVLNHMGSMPSTSFYLKIETVKMFENDKLHSP